MIDGKDANSTDIEGCAMPTLVYLAREKRPQHPHNFKAGAMNALVNYMPRSIAYSDVHPHTFSMSMDA